MNFQIEKRILNYNGKVIGLGVRRGARRGMVPCFPSTIASDIALGAPVWLDDFVGETYSKTRELLDIVHKEGGGTIVCKPLLKASEDGMLVGILTTGNQFIPLAAPEQDMFGADLKVIAMDQYEDANRIGLVGKGQDTARINSMKRIKLESLFFETFRNQARTLLGEFPNAGLRGRLVGVLANHTEDYAGKMGRVIALLTELLTDKVSFVTTDERFISDILGTRDIPAFNICVQDNEQCRLLIPKTNLINDLDNERVYFGRLADELVRYTRIKDFVLNPAAFLSFSHIQYELNQNEIILLQSLLDQAYFDNLVPRTLNKFAKGSGYDTAQPHLSEQYSDHTELQTDNTSIACPKPTVKKVTGKWQRVFPSGSEELEFPNDPPECTFQVALAIASSSNTGVSSIPALKQQLIAAYNKVWPEFGNKIISILSSEGKQSFAKVLRKNEISIDTVVSSEQYFATNLDLWMLADHLSLPIVLYSSTVVAFSKRPLMALSESKDGKYYFIKVPSNRRSVAPKYKLVIQGNARTFASDALSPDIRSTLDAHVAAGEFSLDAYLRAYQFKKLRVVPQFERMTGKSESLEK